MSINIEEASKTSTEEVANKLAHLPKPSEKRIALRVSAEAAKAIKRGHPWLFADSITRSSHEGAAGDLAVIFDKKRNFVAVGLYDPASPIRVKLLHHGRPTPINDAFWRQKVATAQAIRTAIDTTQTTAYRCIHGENDGMPGFVLDRYTDTLVIKLYTAAWLPYLAEIVPLLIADYGATRIVLRLGRRLAQEQTFGLVDGMILYGTVPDAPILFHENGLLFEADVIQGQKTGHFLDQRDNRARVRAIAAGKSVLDVFACTGGFSLYAAAGGANVVVSVDRSRHALAQAERNFEHNRAAGDQQVAQCTHSVIADDAFAVLTAAAEQKRRYDIVVIDPPSFAQKQADIAAALQAYSKLAVLGASVTKREGILVLASCSSRVSAEQFSATIRRAIGNQITITDSTAHAVDHPITFPEGAYLKTIFATVRS